MSILEITLDEMLCARERRAEKQRRLTNEFGLPQLCFTMNIAGEVKDSPLIRLAFDDGMRSIAALPFAHRCERREMHITGPEAYFVFDGDAEQIKHAAVEIEQRSPVARLFDMDVIGADGRKLERQIPRSCLICGQIAAVCARSRAHGLESVKNAQQALLSDFAAEYYAQLARNALTLEVCTTPKPGLVDRRNCGAHKDMNMDMFLRSIDVLGGFFNDSILLGLRNKNVADIMRRLRILGIEAQTRMLYATGGVNTHRGAIYCMGLFLCAEAMCLVNDGLSAAETVTALVKSDLTVDDLNTNGAKACAAYGVSGARGEAALGFPSARRAAQILRGYMQGHDELMASALTLPHIMAELTDTNLLHRGGMDGLRFVQRQAKRICALPEERRLSELEALDDACIEKNLSPGGSADVLALALLMVLAGCD